MPLPATIEIERQNLPEHPAVRAACKLALPLDGLSGIETLKQKDKSAIFRLADAGADGSSIIAKRCLMETAQIERSIYEEILPHLPVPALQLFGFVEDEDARYGWLFLEDAGGELYSPELTEHRAIATRWLAALHTSAAESKTAARLPERGSDFYRAKLRLTRDNITANLANSALRAGELTALKEVLTTCDLLESRWYQLEEFCRMMPSTLVHGDLKEKNIRVRRARTGLVLLPFDWEIAGWGSPAADLLRCPDFGLYWKETRRHWPDLKLRDLQKIGTVGVAFRALIAIYWKTLALQFEWVEWPVKMLAFHRNQLAGAMQALKIG